MADVSAEVLASLITEIEAGKTIREFIQDNDLQGTINAPQLRRQFVTAFGQEYFRNLMRDSNAIRMANRWNIMAARMEDVAKIDEMITTLTNAVAVFEARKVELA